MECSTSKVKVLGLLGLTCVMLGLWYYFTTLPGRTPRVAGWIGVGLSGVAFLRVALMSFRSGPQVVINNEGIDDRRLKIGVIRWEDILSIRSASLANVLCVDVANPEKYLSGLPLRKWSLRAVNKALGYPTLSINFSGLSPGLKEVWAYLQSRPELVRRLGIEQEPTD